MMMLVCANMGLLLSGVTTCMVIMVSPVQGVSGAGVEDENRPTQILMEESREGIF